MNYEQTRQVLVETCPELAGKLPLTWQWRIDLGGANLRGAYLEGAYLGGANLRGAYLGGADLRGAYLGGAYLGGAYLEGADLRGAYLGGAYLRGAYLGGAYLEGADLRGAYLGGAYLEEIIVNWQSHALLSEILWRAADTSEREMLAAWVGRKTEWCWEQWLAVDHPERGWALSELAKWVRGDDEVPDVLRELAKANE